MRYEIVTIFPELIETATRAGLLGKAVDSGLVEIRCITPRQFTSDKHHSVDDAPFGGGSGMVMSIVPLAAACDLLDAEADARGVARAQRILLTPTGKPFVQADAERLAKLPALMLFCGRYEGVDDRIRSIVHEEISLGDFVLNGGEVAALAIIEATARLLPGVIGNHASLHEESHASGLLEYPQFTRPREFRGESVPDELLSGNHAEIARYRRKEALVRTRERRPDLFARLTLSKEDVALLATHDAKAHKP